MSKPKPEPPSWGNISPRHWSKARADMNEEALEYMRERSRAPGVEDGGSHRNSYCMECNGVLPLDYDRRVADDQRKLKECPHCGAEIDARVQAMFNWVEIDQVHGGDAKAMLPVLLGGLVVLGLLAFFALRAIF